MKLPFIARLMRGIIGGGILYLVILTEFLLVKIDFSSGMFNIALIAPFLIGAALALFIVLYKNKSIKQSIASACIFILSYCGFLVLNGYLGTMRWLAHALKLQDNSFADNAFGLLLFFFTSTTVIVLIATIIIRAIMVLVRKHFREEKKLREQ